MPELKLTLIKGDKVSKKTDYRDALPVNMYAVNREILGADGYMLVYPGLTEFADVPGVSRGAIYNERFNNHLRVCGESLIKVNPNGSYIDIGTITGSGPAVMQNLYSFNTQGVIADGKMWLYSPTGGLNEVTDSDLGNPVDGVWVDGYYFLTDGEYIYHTDISDETSIDPLKYAVAEFMPDPSLGVGKTSDNKVIVFGRYTIEYFEDTANANFAFTRIETRAQRLGIVGTHAKCMFGDNWYILGGRKSESISVFLIQGNNDTKIATREIDKIISEYTETELQNVVLECRREEGTLFVIVHLPDKTLCYNHTTAEKFGIDYAWCILKSSIITDTSYNAINGVMDPNIGKWIYGDKLKGRLSYIDNSVCTQYGGKQEWILFTPFVNAETATIDQFEIETIPGNNTTDDATVFLSVTQDGLHYSKEVTMDYGAPGNHGQRFLKRRLGYCRDWVGFKLRGVSTSRMAFALCKVTYG